MKIGFYSRLAMEGIRKNRRMMLPYILTCVGMVMMEYIVSFLSQNAELDAMRGGGSLRMLMGLGVWVIALFSCVFLFYTNSFLMKRRKKEFGLYNILGMGRGNIGRILFWESLTIYLISIAAGLFLGIAFSKTAELALANIMSGTITYTLSVSPMAILSTVEIFGVIFVLLYLNAFRQVRFSSAISLIKSESAGEKPPRANWVLGVLGFLILGGAYALALSVESPLQAVFLFFVAVLMVIIGSYLLLISGSVLLCRILQKNKRYYYKPSHFVSVSSMAYRMRRNGAGLASICILSTMVLVMISSTSCLYFGAEDALRNSMPREINVTLRLDNASQFDQANLERVRTAVRVDAEAMGARPSNIRDLRYWNTTGVLRGSQLLCDRETVDSEMGFFNLRDVFIVPQSDYNELSGETLSLRSGECALRTTNCSYSDRTLRFPGDVELHVADAAPCPDGILTSNLGVINLMLTVVPDADFFTYFSEEMYAGRWEYGFDTGLSAENQITLFERLLDGENGPMMRIYDEETGGGFQMASFTSRAEASDDFYETFGGLFFLGILLSLVFILAAVLMMYYKQISEGYEDQARFEIMQKVGMTGTEIRRSVNSQLLTVFFLPLLLAGLHLIFAFPMIRKLLTLFSLTNVGLFITTTLISFGVFALFYTGVYRITSNVYCGIVGGGRKD